tara:strand:- start:4845 stop:6302 length:1458 start_codon:yes stop_codon:yes gene_type:complete
MIAKYSLIKITKISIIFFLILPLFAKCILIYSGNKLIYLLFSIIFNFYLIYSLRKSSFFFDFFISLFLWFGIWFKFSVQTILFENKFPEGTGNFDFSPSSFDNVLIISFLSVCSLIICSFIIKKFFFSYKKDLKNTSQITNVVDLNRNKIISIATIFLISFLVFYFLNLYFSIYQKGIVYEGNIPNLLYNLIIWTIKIGFPTFASVSIYMMLNFKNDNYKVKSYMLAVLESTFSSISQISRAMIFNPFSMIFGIYKYSQFRNNIFNKKNFLKSYLLLLIFFLFSLFVSSELRSKFYNVYLPDSSSQNKVINKFSSHITNLYFLVGNRWVGIEGIMSSYSIEDKGLKFLKESFKENYNYSQTFYSMNVNKKKNLNKFDKIKNYFSKEELKHIAIFTPGIIGFLNYSGSLVFVIFALSLIFLTCVFVEILVFKLTKNNYIFTSFVANLMAYQLAHFGYMPQNTYKIFIGIFIGLIMVMIINKIIFKR